MHHRLTILFLLLSVTSQTVHTRETSKVVIALYETKRELALLPFYNNTKYKDLDYLQNGIPRFLMSSLTDLVYIRVDKANLRFVINPDNQTLIDIQRKNKYLPGTKLQTPDRIERLRLNTRFEKLNKKNWSIWNLEDVKIQAQKLSSDYLVRGYYELENPNAQFRRYKLSKQNLKITVEMYDAVTTRMYSWSQVVEIDKVYKQQHFFSSQIKKKLLGNQNAHLKVNTTHPGALVFIDDLYLGKTPLQVDTLPGNYSLSIYKENLLPYKHPIRLGSGSKTSLKIKTFKRKYLAGLNVTSNQKDARVYLNMKYIGKTPLKKNNLPAGTHRLRISKKGYVDRIQGIILKNNHVTNVSLRMREGNTQEAFLDPGYILFDWTTYDMSFYSMISSFTFYLGYIYFDTQAHQLRQSIRAQVTGLALWDLAGVYQTSPEMFLYQWNLIQSNTNKAKGLERVAKTSAGIGAAMIVGAVYLFYKAVNDDEKKDTGEVSWFFHQKFEKQAFAKQTTISSRSAQDENPYNTKYVNTKYELGLKINF